MFIFLAADLGAHPFRYSQPRQRPIVYRESAVNVAVVLLGAALVVFAALLVAAAAGKLARIDGATYPAALARAAVTFAAVITLAATVTGALTALLA